MNNGKMHSAAATVQVSDLTMTSGYINDLLKFSINGADQWVLVRSNHADNPILLYLHGGPGAAEMFNRAAQTRLEEYYTVVNWDQRGAGKSYSKNIPSNSMNVNQFISDAIELINIVRKKYNKEKVYLMGHSWGSLIGLLLVKQYPEALYAYIGFGQVVNFCKGEVISYQYAKDAAKMQRNKKAIRELEKIGLPPYATGVNGIAIQRKWLSKFGGVMHRKTSFHTLYDTAARVLNSKVYRFNDFIKFIQGINFTLRKSGLIEELYRIDLFELIPEVKIPVYFFAGRFDYNTPWELVKQYYDAVAAPCKKLVWFEQSAHSPNIEEKDKFCDELIKILQG